MRPGSDRREDYGSAAGTTMGMSMGPTIIAALDDGPMRGDDIEVEVLEGRPPKTLDLAAADGTTCRYCLAGWVQTGRSARYTFLYRV